MIIRKKFKFENAHVVRNCSSDRCKRSIHGHSYTAEILLESESLDYGAMVYDFGLMKGTIKDIVDSFDHAYSMWNKEDIEFREFIQKNSARYIEMPISPSAEGISLLLAFVIDNILDATQFNNGEGRIFLKAVRVHETDTGYAEADMGDVNRLWKWNLTDIKFSRQIIEEWQDSNMWKKLIESEAEFEIMFKNPINKITHG